VTLSFSLGVAAQRAWSGHSTGSPALRRAAGTTGDTAALRRVCLSILCEFAQPLSGVLVYSELLMRHAFAADDAERYELRGLRQGALQLEGLLLSLREAVRASVPLDDSHLVVDRIEQALTHVRRRVPAGST
jgi:hypothetical protein